VEEVFPPAEVHLPKEHVRSAGFLAALHSEVDLCPSMALAPVHHTTDIVHTGAMGCP
jgi:hypothetical protein